MSTNTANLRDKTDFLYRFYIDTVKIRTKGNLNDAAVDSEGFFRNFLNLLYNYNLSKEKIESPYYETIDLHNLERQICVQITARNDKSKVDYTIKKFIETEKFNIYKELHFVIIDRERSFKYDTNKLIKYGVKIFFHDQITIFQTLKDDFDTYDKINQIYQFVKKECSPLLEESDKVELIEEDNINEKIIGNTELALSKADHHIVDQIYDALIIFDGFNFIYPRTIAQLPIFNDNEFDYNSYSHFCLKTTNNDIHQLLQKVKVENHTLIVLDDSLKPFEEKLNVIFSKLNNSLIFCLCYREEYTEIEHHKIKLISNDSKCNCSRCLFYKFNINPLISTLKGKAISHSDNLNDALGEAFYLSKIGEHVKSWQVFNHISEKSKNNGNDVTNFIALFNIKSIRNAIDTPWWEDENGSIIPKIDSIDLFETLSSYGIPIQLRDELIKLKEDYFLHYSKEKIYKLFDSIKNTNKIYRQGGFSSGSDAIILLHEELYIIFHFYINNHIVTDDSFAFRDLITKGIEGVLISFTTHENYDHRFKEFDYFLLSLMIFYLDENRLEKLLKEYKIDRIPIEEIERELITKSLTNFFTFQYSKVFGNTLDFNDDIFKLNYFSPFRQSLRNQFNKVMMILSRIDLRDDELKLLAQPIVDFISVAEDFYHTNWKFTALFLDKKIQVFSSLQITTIIEQTIDEKRHRNGDDYFEIICEIASRKVNFIISDLEAFDQILTTVSSKCTKCKRVHDSSQLLGCWNIAPNFYKEIIRAKAVKYLENNFDPEFYEKAVFKKIFSKENYPTFLKNFIDCTVKACTPYDIKKVKGRWQTQSYVGSNYLNCLAYMKVNFKQKKIQAISKISDQYNFLINPKNVDYSEFDLQWMMLSCPYYIRQKLSSVIPLKTKIKEELSINYDANLAEFYVKFLS